MQNLHPFLHHVLEFHLRGRHLIQGASVDDGDVRALAARYRRHVMGGLAQHDVFRMVFLVDVLDMPEPARDSRHVHGGVAASNHEHPL